MILHFKSEEDLNCFKRKMTIRTPATTKNDNDHSNKDNVIIINEKPALSSNSRSGFKLDKLMKYEQKANLVWFIILFSNMGSQKNTLKLPVWLKICIWDE